MIPLAMDERGQTHARAQEPSSAFAATAGSSSSASHAVVRSPAPATEPCPYDVYFAAFSVMSRHVETGAPLELLPLPALRRDIAGALPASPGELSVPDSALRATMDDFRALQQQQQKRASSSVSGTLLKYSSRETAIILGVVDSFCHDHGLAPEDVCSQLRPARAHLKGPKKELVRQLFDDVAAIVPYRQRDALKFFVERKVFLSVHALKGRWSDEEKDRLVALHAQIGPKWARLARELGKRAEDVRVVFKQLECVKKGKYTPEEEARLEGAVREVVGMRDRPLADLPQLGISWSAVAQLMRNERNSVEYQIKWMHLRQRLLFGKAGVAAADDLLRIDLLVVEVSTCYKDGRA